MVIVYFQLLTVDSIFQMVGPAAGLVTIPPVGGGVEKSKTHVAFARNSNTQSAVDKNFYLHKFPGRSCDLLSVYAFTNFCDMLQIQLSSGFKSLVIIFYPPVFGL